MGTGQRFDVSKLKGDLDARGWIATDLARHAGVSDMTVTRVMRGSCTNARTWAKLAEALGFSPRRYAIAARGKAA